MEERNYHNLQWSDATFIGFVVNRESSESDGALAAGTDGMTSYEMEARSGPMAVPMRVDCDE